jgi:hypothetical protein
LLCFPVSLGRRWNIAHQRFLIAQTYVACGNFMRRTPGVGVDLLEIDFTVCVCDD